MLILDEPTKGIDVGAKSEISEMMLRLAREGIGILLISSETAGNPGAQRPRAGDAGGPDRRRARSRDDAPAKRIMSYATTG